MAEEECDGLASKDKYSDSFLRKLTVGMTKSQILSTVRSSYAQRFAQDYWQKAGTETLELRSRMMIYTHPSGAWIGYPADPGWGPRD